MEIKKENIEIIVVCENCGCSYNDHLNLIEDGGIACAYIPNEPIKEILKHRHVWIYKVSYTPSIDSVSKPSKFTVESGLHSNLSSIQGVGISVPPSPLIINIDDQTEPP